MRIEYFLSVVRSSQRHFIFAGGIPARDIASPLPLSPPRPRALYAEFYFKYGIGKNIHFTGFCGYDIYERLGPGKQVDSLGGEVDSKELFRMVAGMLPGDFEVRVHTSEVRTVGAQDVFPSREVVPNPLVTWRGL